MRAQAKSGHRRLSSDEGFDLSAALHGGKMRTSEKGKKVGPVSD
jgi:hypothetical protein